MQEPCLVDTRVAFVTTIATTGAMDPHSRSIKNLDHSPRPELLPSGHGLKPKRNLSLSSTDPKYDQRVLPTPRSPTLKRKAGSSNLVSSYSPQISSSADAIPSPASTNPANGEFRIGHLSDPTQSRSANIHSFAFDLNRYLYQLSQSRLSNPPVNRRHHLDAAGEALDRIPRDQSASQPQLTHKPISSAFSRHSNRSNLPSSKKSRNVTRSDPSGSAISDASTLSLSRFPLPPTSTEPSDPNSSRDRDEPRTPTIYHFRGASFELVNPRSSLRIENIEVPAEQDLHKTAYFLITSKESSQSHSAETVLRGIRPWVSDMEKSNLRETPQRSLFDDLPSAYNSIRKNRKISTPLPDRFLPSSSPSPIERSKLFDDSSASTENLLENEIEPQIQRPSPAISFRQRFSQVFRFGGKSMFEHDMERNSARALYSDPSEAIRVHEQDSAGDKLFDANFGNHNENIALPRPKNPVHRFGDKSSRHYYDDPSIFDSSMARSRSTSFHPVVVRQRNHESLPWTELEREESTENLIASYGYDYSDPGRSSAFSTLSRHRSMPLFLARNSTPTTNKQADSTIGEILEQYHHRDTSSLPFFHSSSQENNLRTMHPKSSSPIMTPSSQDLKGFDFGLDKQPEKPEDEGGFEARPDENIRTATARALNTARGAPPLGPLPSNPLNRLENGSMGIGSQAFSGNSSDSAISYGDTRNLLLLSQPSIEMERGITASNLGVSKNGSTSNSFEGTAANRAQPSLLTEPIRRKTPTDEENRRVSDRSYEDIVSRDLKYLSRLSGLSNFQGSVYMVGSTTSGQAYESDNSKNETRDSSRVQKSSPGQWREPQKPVHASCLPIAAFQQSAVVPGILRLPTADRKAFGKIHEPSKGTEDSDSSIEEILSNESADEGSDDELDWETLPESRRTLRSQKTNDDSFAEWSSYNSLNTFRNVNMHPGDSRLQHEYRLHSPDNSDVPVLIPAYEFRGGPGFPNRNALTPPTPAIYNTYKHPLPLSQIHENPFTSSPPQITGKAISQTPVIGAKSNASCVSSSSKKDENLSLFSLRRHNLSVVPEQTGEVSTSKKSISPVNSLRRLSHSGNFSKIPTQGSSGLLSSEPGPEVSLEAEHGSPSESERGKRRPRSAKLSSGVDPGLIHILRKGDPRMASSPLSATNSFARVSHLGPRGNITGTPNGTSMREVGSSLIGSSSPVGIPSSPPIVQYSTPITEANTDLRSPQAVAIGHASSPLARLDNFQYGFGDHSAVGKHRRGLSFRDALVAEGHAERQARRAVQGQRELIEMTLNPHDGKISPHQSNEACNQHRGPVGEPLQPLLPPPATNSSFPKIRSRYRSPSSEASSTRKRKQKISWVCFALCTVFPFTLILYGHGILDAVIAHWTAGDIRHFGRRQKTTAKVVGWGAAVTTILIVIILFVVIRTVPNGYPR